MIPFLPVEIVQLILEHLTLRLTSLDSCRQRDLARCCLTSKLFQSVAQPLLYSQLEIRQLIAYHFNYPEPRHYTDRCGCLLIKAFGRNEHLCHLVKELTIRGVRDGDFWHTSKEQESFETLMNLIQRLSSLKIIVFDNLIHIPYLEQVVATEQDRSSRLNQETMPELRVKGDGWYYEYGTIRLSARYEGYNSGSIFYRHVDWSNTLASSQHSLKRLSIPFDATRSIATFTQLESLSLGLSDSPPRTPIVSLIDTLSGLLHLRSLIIKASPLDTNLHSVLDPRQHATSSPPSLSRLSLELRTEMGDLHLIYRGSTIEER